MSEIITSILSSTFVLSTPILFASLGEIYDERAGVLNLGIEATISLGGFIGLWTGFMTGSHLIGTLAAMFAGALIALIHAYSSVKIGINQLISGLLIIMLADGIANFAYSRLPFVPIMNPLQSISIPLLSDIPVLGSILFQHNLYVYSSFLLALVMGFILYRTTWGLSIRGTGENPEASDAAGINVTRVRMICVVLSGVFAGLAGASITLGYIGLYGRGIAAGRGWIAIIVVILSRWSPYRAIRASLLFGFGYALAANLIGVGVGIPYFFLLMIPYIFALIVIIFLLRKTRGPAALTIPYKRK